MVIPSFVQLPETLKRAALDRGVALLNRLLGDDARARLAPHRGKSATLLSGGVEIAVVVEDPGVFALRPDAAAATAPELRIDADLAALLAARMRGQPVGGVRIAGDAEFAQAVSWSLEHLQLDVEDELAPWLGDIVAHRVGRAAHDARTQLQGLRRRAADDVRAWLGEAPRLVVSRAEFDSAAAAVARLRDAAARLDKRIALLQRRLPD